MHRAAQIASFLLILLASQPAIAHDDAPGHVPCEGGRAGEYACHDVDMLAHLPLHEIGGGGGNDVWGWTDSKTGKEYALMGRSTGVAIVDVSEPEAPVYLGDLPTHTVPSGWRDIKVIGDFALVVSEAPGHGLQIFNLRRLRRVENPPKTFAAYFHYDEFGNAHNIAVNEESGYAYAVGTDTCFGGLHMVDVSNPKRPLFAGCFADDGYTHDAQCVIYRGPDAAFAGREICLAANEDTLTIVDVTDKGAPEMLARTAYAGGGYAHQGWLTEDHAYFLLNDELDELVFGHGARTYVWDVSDLRAPRVAGTYDTDLDTIDHNLYVVGAHVFQANYGAGLRILEMRNLRRARLREVAFFDVHPDDDLVSAHPEDDADGDGVKDFLGAWSVYPYFESGTLVVSSMERGLFVLWPTFPGYTPANSCPFALGNPRYCRECGPCAEGEGGCKRDKHCQEGLVCVPDVGADYGFRPRLDVCLPE